MRLFIAINLEDNIKEKLQSIIGKIEKHATQGKFVSNEHMHLTLEFLGEMEQSKLSIIKEAMDQIACEPFKLRLSGIGFFKRREGNIYWFGINKNETLLEIQQRLHNQLVIKGFELETREYKPHLTIGRKVRLNDGFNENYYKEEIDEIEVNINQIDLMKSENVNGRLIYSIVYSKSLN